MASKGSGFSLDLLTLVINASAQPVVDEIKKAEQAVQNFGNSVGAGLQFAAGFAALAVGVKGIQSAFEDLSKAVTSVNDDLFKFEVQFKTVMGNDADAAKGSILELQDIARGSIFNTAQFAAAERAMRNLGGAALDTRENLKLFEASAVGTDNSLEMTTQILSRLYGTVQEGLPIGRLSLQLQRMNLVSAETIAKAQEMQKQGASSAKVWDMIAESLQRFSKADDEAVGNIDRFSKVIAENIDIWQANAFEPIYVGFRNLFHAISDISQDQRIIQWSYNVRAVFELLGNHFTQASFGFTSLGQAIAGFVEGAGNSLIDLINNASVWGTGLVKAYAEGITYGINYVVDALSGLADIIASWMEPHSPPKFLPFIDKWGLETAQLWMDGFSKVDTSVINDLSKQIEEELRNAFRTKGEFDLENALFSMRANIVSAMHDIQEFGSISQSTWDSIHAATGPVGDDIDRQISLYFDLAEAQERVAQATYELKNLQEEYNDAIRPLDREIDKLQTKERIMRAQNDIAKAMEAQAKGKDPGGVGVEEAQLKMAILQAQIRKDQLKLQFAEEKDAAEDKLRLAKNQEDADKEEIDNIKNKSAWMKDNIRIWDEFNKVASGGGGKGNGGGVLDNFTSGLEEARKRIEAEKQRIADALKDIGEKLKPAEEAWNSLLVPIEKFALAVKSAWDELQKFQAAWEKRPITTIENVEGLDVTKGIGAMPVLTSSNPYQRLADDIHAEMKRIAEFFQPVSDAWQRMTETFPTYWNSGMALVTKVWNQTIEKMTSSMEFVKIQWDILWDLIEGAVRVSMYATRDIIVIILDIIGQRWDDVGVDISNMWEDVKGNTITTFTALWEDVKKGFSELGSEIKRWVDIIQGWFNGIKFPSFPSVPNPIDNIHNAGKEFIDNAPPNSDISKAIIGKITGNASGTSSWRGGLTLVGENGPELVNLPSASQIFNNNDTMGMLTGFKNPSITHSPVYQIYGNQEEIETAINNTTTLTLEKFRDLLGKFMGNL